MGGNISVNGGVSRNEGCARLKSDFASINVGSVSINGSVATTNGGSASINGGRPSAATEQCAAQLPFPSLLAA
eukprot:3941298-Rhodomonas_salina.3